MLDNRAGVRPLAATELRSMLDSGAPLSLLDVREDDERAFARIEVAANTIDLHVPMGRITARFDEIESAAAERALVVYCHHGVRSLAVVTWLAKHGIGNVFNLEGGIDAWSLTVDPRVRRY